MLPTNIPIGWFEVSLDEWKESLDVELHDLMKDKLFQSWTMNQIIAFSRDQKKRIKKQDSTNVNFDDLCREILCFS